MTAASARVGRAAFALALLAGVAPLFCARQLPMVDLPQHLHLISVLHRLDDPTTLYPRVFAARAELTPYVGYYDTVSLLSWIVPLELANRLFLAAMVAGLPLAMAFLLRSLGRPRWPAVLTLPFAYGDSFGWGFVNSSASFALALLASGLFVRALNDPERRRRWALAHAAGAGGRAADARPGLPLPGARASLPAPDHSRARGRDRARSPPTAPGAALHPARGDAVPGVGGRPAARPRGGGGGRAVEGVGATPLGTEPVLQAVPAERAGVPGGAGQPPPRRGRPVGAPGSHRHRRRRARPVARRASARPRARGRWSAGGSSGWPCSPGSSSSCCPSTSGAPSTT